MHNTDMDKQTSPKIELCAEADTWVPGMFRACIKRNDSVSYLSQQNFPTPDEAQKHAARVFLGIVSGYRF